MKRALRAWAAAATLWATACSGDDTGAAAADAGRPGAPAPDASAVHDAAAEMDARLPDRDADVLPDAGDAAAPAALPDFVGDDHVRFDALAASARGVVRFAFDVPDDAVSFVASVQARRGPSTIQLIELTGPDGLLWSALEDGPFEYQPTMRVNVNDFVPFALMLPSSPDGPALSAGRHELSVRVGTDADAAVAADVIFKRAQRGIVTGALEVVLWFVEGAGIDAGGAGGSARMQGALDLFRSIYGANGIDVSVAGYRDLPGADLAELVLLDDDAEAAALLARLEIEASPSDRALHFVFVARIETGATSTVRARSTGLPGPPSHPELTRRGAVIVAYETLPATATRIGQALAHEAGHYLGLRHTSEFDGLRHDAIADTAECPAERASQTSSDGTPVLSAEDCADLDGSNLLFYTQPQQSTAQADVSAGQRFVLLRNPAVR